MVLVAWPQFAFADAPPGAYLDSTNKSQKSASNTPAATAPNTGPDAGYQSMNPAAGAPPTYGQMSQGQWNGQSQTQTYPQQSQTYSGFAQQTYTPPPTYQPQPNYGAPPVNPGGANWQADYPSLGELNGGGGAPPYGQGAAPPPQTNWGQSQAPQTATTNKNTNPKTAAASTDKDKDDNTAKTISTIANTVLPIATSVVTTAIMNKMMYGTMMPGYRSGYGYPYGGSGYPMGGYGYNRPGMMNGLLGGNSSPGLMNMHF